MSLILDAIKKTEEDRLETRNQPSTPITKTTPSKISTSQANNNSAKGYFLIGFLFIAGCIIILNIYNRQGGKDSLVESNSALQAQTPISAISEIPKKTLEDKTQILGISKQSPAKVTPKSATQVTPAPRLKLLDTPHISELPAKTQERFPRINYQSHWYDPRPEKRIVIINDRSLKEGAVLKEGIKIQNITKKGVILSYNGELFHLSMLQTWPESF